MTGLCVITLGDSLTEFSIGSLCSASIHASLIDKSLIAVGHLNQLAILSLHNFAPNSIGSYVLLNEIFTICGVKVTLLIPSVNCSLSLSHFLHDLALNFSLHDLLLAADACDSGCRVLARTILSVVGVHELLVGLAIDAVVRVVELFTRDGVLEIEVLLCDVRLCHSPN